MLKLVAALIDAVYAKGDRALRYDDNEAYSKCGTPRPVAGFRPSKSERGFGESFGESNLAKPTLCREQDDEASYFLWLYSHMQIAGTTSGLACLSAPIPVSGNFAVSSPLDVKITLQVLASFSIGSSVDQTILVPQTV